MATSTPRHLIGGSEFSLCFHRFHPIRVGTWKAPSRTMDKPVSIGRADPEVEVDGAEMDGFIQVCPSAGPRGAEPSRSPLGPPHQGTDPGPGGDEPSRSHRGPPGRRASLGFGDDEVFWTYLGSITMGRHGARPIFPDGKRGRCRWNLPGVLCCGLLLLAAIPPLLIWA